MQLTIELPSREQQMLFNRIRWTEVLADPTVISFPYRVETNAFGQITMNPPASGGHSTRQGRITVLLDRLLGGHSLPECPISTIDGVKVADVGWYSEARLVRLDGQVAFEIAPEICVEVLSPSNTKFEIDYKRTVYFEAGAEEFWVCDLEGRMSYFQRDNPTENRSSSQICPNFPNAI